MRKASFFWMIGGVVLGAATTMLVVGARPSSAGLTPSEAQAVAEVQDLLGDPMPVGSDSASDWLPGTPAPLGSPPFPLARELATTEPQDASPKPVLPRTPVNDLINRPHNWAELQGAERLHAPTMSEPIEAHVSIPDRQPAPLHAPHLICGPDHLPFHGSHSCRLGKPGRICLPEGVCRQLKIAGMLFVTPGLDGCLELYPQVALDRDPTGRTLEEDDSRRRRRLWFSRMTPLRVERADDACIIELPPALVGAADLDGYLVIIGVDDHFEIWDAQRWQDYIESGSEVLTNGNDQ